MLCCVGMLIVIAPKNGGTTLSLMPLSIMEECCYALSFMPAVVYAKCCKLAPYAECHYAECHYAVCRYDECRGAKKTAEDSYLMSLTIPT